jgi:hypothetical protein
MKTVELEYDTLGVPEKHKNAAARFNALDTSPPVVQLPKPETGRLTSWGYGPSLEWVEYNASYSTLENIRLAVETAAV